jgi:hypothetical protein
MTAGGRTSAVWLVWGAIVVWGGCSSSTSPEDAGTPVEGGKPLEPVLDAGGVPAMPPDGKSLCPTGVCNYQTNEGCAANQTCAPSDADGTSPKCWSAGMTGLGGVCGPWTDCVPGAICAAGFCRKLCCGRDWTGCSQGEHCISRLGVIINGQTVDTGAYLCMPVNDCSALEPASCTQPGTTCQIVDPTGATACFREGTGAAGEPCPCKGGFTCVANGCRRLCKAVAGGAEPFCPPTEGRCVHFTRDPADVGECTPL